MTKTNKKHYQTPISEFLYFDEDVITTSGANSTPDYSGEPATDEDPDLNFYY